MRPPQTFLLVACTWLAAVPLSRSFAADAVTVNDDFFRRRIAPVLESKCLGCHSEEKAKGQLSLVTLAGARKGGKEGVALVPGKPEESPLYTRTLPTDDEPPEMPEKGDPLSKDEADALRAWIAAGSPWPEGHVLKERAKADKTWWAYQPLRNEEPPKVDGLPERWTRNPIDAFVFAGLREKGLEPNPPATPRALIRRMSYDLIGLPPTPEETDAFAADFARDEDRAVEALADRLLASPQYGEQWGRHWLDVVRFGESNGFERNVIINSLWPFRDYVIRSFNQDKPFDQFIAEQLAGDVIGRGKPEVEIGTAFLVCGPYDNVGNQDPVAAAQIRANTLDDMIRATGETFLGITVGCARCHDHKFDPVLASDYYRLYATFAGVQHGERSVATDEERKQHDTKKASLEAERGRLQKERDEQNKELKQGSAGEGKTALVAALEKRLAEIGAQLAALKPLPRWWVGRFEPAPGPFHIFTGGDPQKRGQEVTPGALSFLQETTKGYTLDAQSGEGERRLALAKWLAAPDNPLTPRVLANRLWHYHFGTGIVDTPSDFGYMGGRPTHPELLDWLARQVHASGWRLKPLHKLIVTSQTYRQSGAMRPDAAKVDGGSRLLWRFPPRRLAAEEVRDTLLSIAGKLDLRMGGPGFRLYDYQEDNVATYVPLDVLGPGTYRRAVYHQNARAQRVDLMNEFDCPDPAFAEPRRASTTTPLQALTLMNHRFVFDMAGFLAERITREAGEGNAEAQAKRAFAITFLREPSTGELAAATQLIQSHGLRAICRALLNSNELIYLN